MKFQHALLLVCATVLIIILLPSDKPTTTGSKRSEHPQEYMSRVAMWAYSKEGSLKNKVSAEYWAYLPEVRASQLASPELTIYKPDHTEWRIRAKRGIVLQPDVGHIQEVELEEDVFLERPASAKAAPIRLETSRVRYRPKDSYVETDEPITMIRPELTITGRGMRAFLDKSIVELLHDVKTHYVSSP